MKILIVIPRYNLTTKVNYNYLFPLGLAYISSVIKKAGYDVNCLNLNHLNGPIEGIIVSCLNKKKYDVICTGHIGIGYHVIKKIIDSVRNHVTKPKIILGGAIITSEPKLIFESLLPDYAVLGEGEITIVELLECIERNKDFNKVKGIMFKDNNSLIITPEREPIQNLDSLPFPDFEGFGFSKQLENMVTNDPWSNSNNLLDFPRTYPILCSRCCPFSCTFCYHPLGKQYRKRSIKNVMKELELAIKKYNINIIVIFDDLFSADKNRLYEFCKEIKKLFKKYNFRGFWSCQLSVHNIDREMLTTLKDAGCSIISFGFESMSPVVLKSMKKPITPEQIDNAIRLCMEENMSIQGNFIFGDIAETTRTAYETLNYWKIHCKGQISMDFIQPYPGSEIYNYCVKKGIIKDKLEFIKNIEIQNFFNMTEKMSNKEIEKLKSDILAALVKYRRSIFPISIKKMEGNKYEVKIKCPYCKEIINYRNFYIKNKIFFGSFMTCRKCKMRFGISSPLKRLVYSLYHLVQPFTRSYVRIRNNFKKKSL